MRAAGIVLALTVLIGAVGCASPERQKNTGVQPSGFLGDYSKMQPGLEGQAQLVYVSPDAGFSDYRLVILDPITFWYRPGGTLEEVPKETRRMVARHLTKAIHQELRRDYGFTMDSGPEVMRLRVAITEEAGSTIVGDTVTTAVPVTRLPPGDRELDAGSRKFMGTAAVEVELVDSLTGTRLAAAVANEAGGQKLSGQTSTWADVDAAFGFWAKRMRERLAELRAGRR
jgi:hypothetical protein